MTIIHNSLDFNLISARFPSVRSSLLEVVRRTTVWFQRHLIERGQKDDRLFFLLKRVIYDDVLISGVVDLFLWLRKLSSCKGPRYSGEGRAETLAVEIVWVGLEWVWFRREKMKLRVTSDVFLCDFLTRWR